MLVYAGLVLAYWFGMHFNNRLRWLAFSLAVLYAISDEFHQSFVPGRHPSWVDVVIFDSSGGALMLVAATKVREKMHR